jgi:hypothetical protein
VAASPGLAQGVTMTAQVGFGGYYKVGHWAPVTIVIENRGGAFEGEIRFEKSQMLSLAGTAPGLVPTATYVKPVSIPSASKKRFNLYVRLDKTTSRAEVSLRSGWRTVAQHEVKLNALYDEDELIVVYALEKGALSYLAGLKSPKPATAPSGITFGLPGAGGGQRTQAGAGSIVVQYASRDYMPDSWVGYDSADVLVLGRISPKTLSARQQGAIRGWVASGGGLVVSGGIDWQRLSEPFFRSLLPLSPDGAVEVREPGELASVYGSSLGSDAPIAVTTGALSSGSSIYLEEPAVPLIAEREYGAGRVIFLAFDYAAEPIRSWRAGDKMWLDLMSMAYRKGLVASALEREAAARSSSYGYGYTYTSSSGTIYTSYGSRAPSILSALTFSQMDPPSFGLVGLFLIAYVLCLVPATYLVLTKLRKKELAWRVMPVIVIVFSVAAYLTSYAVKGGEILVNQVAFIETSSGSPEAAADTFALIFSPKKTSYNVSCDAASAVIEAHGESEDESLSNWAEGLTYLQAEKPSIPGLAMNMWSSRAFHAKSIVDLGGGVSVSLTEGGGSGRITNDTPFDLSDCCLVVPDKGSGSVAVHYIGEIPHGESIDVQEAIARSASSPAAQLGGSDLMAAAAGAESPERRSMMQRAVEAVYEPSKSSRSGSPYLVAWSQDRLPRIDVKKGRPRVLCADMFLIEARLDSGARTVFYPEALSTAQVTKTTGRANTYDPSVLVELSGESSAEVGISLPRLGPTLVPDSLGIRLSVVCAGRSQSSPEVEVSLYSRSARRWRAFLSNKTLGRGSTDEWRISPPDPAQYVGSDGKVALRIKTAAGENQLMVREAAAQLSGHRR